MKAKTAKKVFTLLLTMALLMTVGSFPAKTALADAGEPNENSIAGLCYISDNAHSLTYCNALSAAGVVSSPTLYYYPTDFYSNFLLNYNLGTYDNISNTYVIFEIGVLRQEIILEDESNTVFLDVLDVFFDTLEGRNCKIMFICGTDETRFLSHNAFLDHVDIHVNTDVFGLFVMNIFNTLIVKCGTRNLFETTFILDSYLTSHQADETVVNSWFFKEWLMPYFLTVSDGYAGAVDADVFFGSNKIFCQIQNNAFCDVIQGQNVTFDSNDINETSEIIKNKYICAIGMGPDADDFADLIDDFADYGGENFFGIYIYGNSNVTTDGNIYTMNGSNNFYGVIYDFVTGENLTQYNNILGGRCAITYRPLEDDDDAWMIELSGVNGFVVDGWKIFMTEEDRAFYTNTSENGRYWVVWPASLTA